MTGKDIALTERDKRILAEISRFGVMSREQLMTLRVFKSKTRANERLKKLTDAGYLLGHRQPMERGGPRLLYLPGVKLQSRDRHRNLHSTSSLFLSHQLGLVDIRLAFEQHTQLTRWLSDKELTSLSLGVTPDSFLELVVAELSYCAFVEYDRGTEPLGRIERKVRAYLDLAFSGRFERTFHRRFFKVLLITDTAGRLESLTHTVARLTDRVVRLVRLPELMQQGPLKSIWRRPGSTGTESLTGS